MKALFLVEGEGQEGDLDFVTDAPGSFTLEEKQENHMQFNVPPDLEILVRKRLATGTF